MDSGTSQVVVFVRDVITVILLCKHCVSSLRPLGEKQMTYKSTCTLLMPLFKSRPVNHFSSKLNLIPVRNAHLHGYNKDKVTFDSGDTIIALRKLFDTVHNSQTLTVHRWTGTKVQQPPKKPPLLTQRKGFELCYFITSCCLKVQQKQITQDHSAPPGAW